MKRILFSGLILLVLVFPVSEVKARMHFDPETMGLGMPFGGPAEPDGLDKCPQGVHVVRQFIHAWSRQDWRMMYDLLDPGVKEEYSFDQAELDFQALEYRPYRISSVRKIGDDYEFLLSYGEWQYGDKDNQKMVVSGTSYRILMPRRGSPFQRSIASFF